MSIVYLKFFVILINYFLYIYTYYQKTLLRKSKITHKLIATRTPWHNGNVERSRRNDQRYFYDWETFCGAEEPNAKPAEHLVWSKNKPTKTLKEKTNRDVRKKT